MAPGADYYDLGRTKTPLMRITPLSPWFRDDLCLGTLGELDNLSIDGSSGDGLTRGDAAQQPEVVVVNENEVVDLQDRLEVID